MVLKFEGDDEVFIIDATYSGVNITNWSQFCLYKNEYYSKIVWRKLHVDRDDNFISRLGGFIKSVHKKKYKLSVSKLLKRQSVMPLLSITESDSAIDKDRTFFCSELIAKAYKVLGIFNSDISCSQIFPKHFSAINEGLKLDNAYLEEERIIVEDKQ